MRPDVRAPRLLLVLAALAPAAPGCAPTLPELRPSSITSAAARAELSAIAERFYAARTPAELRAAAAEAEAEAPRSALRHELLAQLEQLELGPPGARFVHAAAALRDPAALTPHLWIERLLGAIQTPEQLARGRRLLAALRAEARDPALAAHVSRAAAHLAWRAGDFDAARALEAEVRPGFDWRVIGGFDNDQGKGFEERLPPEREFDLEARYEGAILEVGWRSVTPAPVGPALDLGAALSPPRWAVAYATTTFEDPAGGARELRLTTSAPIKVWLDGRLVFAERLVTRASFEQFVVPVRLAPGRHRLLVKLAQDEGPWVFGARITAPGGAPFELRPLPPASAPTEGSEALGPSSGAEVLAAREAELRRAAGPLRARALARVEAEARGLRAEALRASEALLQASPESLVARWARARSTYAHGERGKASDLLEALVSAHGAALPGLPLEGARRARGDGLLRKARDLLAAAEAASGPSAEAALLVETAAQSAKEGWTEDRCRALERALTIRPGWLDVQLELGACLAELGFLDEAWGRWEAAYEGQPGHALAPSRLASSSLGAGRLEAAEAWARRLVALAPHQVWPRLRLAEALRRQRRWSAAEAALIAGRALDPDAAAPWGRLGQLRYQAKDEAGAIAAWRESLLRNPDDDRLANRLAQLAPEDEGSWTADIPDEAALLAAVAAREGVRPAPGAHVLNLLDHEVTLLKPDGSITDVVTLVAHALDETGRDQLTRVQLRSGGRLRLLAAYALGPDGTRTQVSSVRRRVARFRNLSVGSTVVLQYRHDAKPVGYLARHMARGWWFQAPSGQTLRSEWVLWLPEGSTLHEWAHDPEGRVRRDTRTEDGLERVAWVAEDVAPLIAEPQMPTQREVALNMLVSTVPDWATFLEWEKALLSEAFREDARIEQLAQEIVGDAASPREKALRIHGWLMREIRYQQDYEDHIAGVRPHPAPVVLERSYGDCKDKSVLFITLARQVGLEAHFALLRTRPRGPVLRAVPMQQFDHAIVYVPAQPGLEAGFFVDSTAEALDLGALRQDDAGALALVVDPEAGRHTWRSIPFRPPEENAQHTRAELVLRADGAAEGRLWLKGQGAVGSALRRIARNRRALEQAMQGVAARMYGDAVAREITAVETSDLRRPAELSMALGLPSLGRAEGRQMRVRLPRVSELSQSFQLESRRHPLVLGVPRASSMVTRVELPPGLRVGRPPEDARVDAPCFRFERTTRVSERVVTIEQRYASTCERIEVEAYAAHRQEAQAMMRALEQELVLVTAAARRPSRRP